ncbi:MAG: hypothetical protein JO008_18115, partial [Alphaproteobacteria bacterium]|nr:hypothetical protein [Alphaproteobacteria bacterium]
MDKKIAALLGAVAGLATMASAQASTGSAANQSETLKASSYADLLAPVGNASEALKADDAARAQNPEGGFRLAQWWYYRRYRHHHHHHHH